MNGRGATGATGGPQSCHFGPHSLLIGRFELQVCCLLFGFVLLRVYLFLLFLCRIFTKRANPSVRFQRNLGLEELVVVPTGFFHMIDLDGFVFEWQQRNVLCAFFFQPFNLLAFFVFLR